MEKEQVTADAGKIRVKLTIAYQGTNYAGWQVQKTGVGVQEKVEQVLQRYFPGVTRLHSSSRTDTGVHAIGMVAHVDIPKAELTMSLEKLPLSLNAFLAADIRVLSASKVSPDFHARFQATGKQYRYFLWNHRGMNPLLRHSAWHVPRPLDVAAMRTAAKVFLGKHDFKSFAASRGYEPETTVRTLSRCDIRRSDALLTFVIEGDGFLYKMCRGIVGTLVQVGQGKIAVADVKSMFGERDRRVAGMTAPAQGLVLWKVFYSPRKGLPPKQR
jgi:tRNA pseudouridine38-40 synthase